MRSRQTWTFRCQRREALRFMKREIAAGLKRLPCQPFICHNLRNVGYSKNLEKEYWLLSSTQKKRLEKSHIRNFGQITFCRPQIFIAIFTKQTASIQFGNLFIHSIMEAHMEISRTIGIKTGICRKKLANQVWKKKCETFYSIELVIRWWCVVELLCN